MISFLRGVVAFKTTQSADLDVHGVGYLLHMSMDAIAKLPAVGEEAFVPCRMIASDSGVALYGFSNESERELFDLLITVSGIGPKTALAALSVFSATDLIAAIVAQDVKTVSKIPGVGKKSASRIVLELKDKFPETSAPFDEDNLFNMTSPVIADVTEALRSMGFTAEEAELAMKDADAGFSEQELLQYALKRLAK